MSKRDKAIISDLERFGAMNRDQLIAIHFQGLRNPISNANAVMLRLYRQNRIERNADFSQYVYFPKHGGVSKNSPKLRHYLAIVDTYIEMRRLGAVDSFIVEPKYANKGRAEPDAFTIWRGSPFFIEVQRSRINQREIANKIKRTGTKGSGVINRK